jgi:hypothetical protein
MEQIDQYERLLIVIGFSSIALFLGSVILIPLIIAYLPHDYFVRAIKPFKRLHLLHMAVRILMNTIGSIFLLAGFIMLFIPGQGILTILLGLSLINFPGKRRLETRLLNTRRVKRMIKWCRQKSGREPLVIPEELE